MKGYELSMKDSEPSSPPTQVSVTVGDGGGRVTEITYGVIGQNVLSCAFS